MTDNVIRLVPKQIGEGVVLSSDAVLDGARGKLSEAVVIGVEGNGDLYLASTHSLRDVIYMLELAKMALLAVE